MNYPDEILPNPNRKLISCDISNHFLIRSTKSNVRSELLDESTGEIFQQTICSPTENITDLSTSILGVFTKDHNLIELTALGKEKFALYCEPDVSSEVPIYKIDFDILENKGFWTILIDKIINHPVEYTFGDNPDKTFKAVCSIVHTPALWNYWHFSIRWFLNEHNCFLDQLDDQKKKKKISKRLSGQARALVAKFAKVEEPNYQQLHVECYTKN